MFTIQSLHVSLEVWGSIFCLIISICLFMGRRSGEGYWKLMLYMQLVNVLLLVMDAFAWGFRGSPGHLGYWMVRISNCSVFILQYVMVALYHTWICKTIFDKQKTEKTPRVVYSVYGIETTAILFIVISQFTNWFYYFDANNVYHRSTLFPIAIVLGLMGGGIDFYLMLRYRKRISKMTFMSELSYIVLPLLAVIIQFLFYGVSWINLAITISLVIMFLVYIMEQSQLLVAKEKELYDMQVSVMLSQIGPHFIYNTLAVIRHLCKKDAGLAEETIDEFAGYLRGNLDFLSRQECITFEKEQMHTKNYLAIEKKRFGERLLVVWKTDVVDFLLPGLTMQPLVENAVKHGIMRREEGGTIWISTEEKENAYVICIEDDGVGFSPEAIEKDGKIHIGIKNVKSRVEAMCGGTVVVHSCPGKGTKVLIQIPKGENGHENIGS